MSFPYSNAIYYLRRYRVENGWVKFYRKIMQSEVWWNTELYQVWSWCLMKASHQERWIWVKIGRGSKQVRLLPGQFIFGRNIAAKELPMKPTSIRTRLLRLSKMGNVDIQVDTHYSIVTICNWEDYQNAEVEVRQPTGSLTDNQPTDNRQQTDTDKKVETVKTVKKSIPLIPFGEDGQWEKFWKAYPKRKSKQDAIKAWNQLEPDDGLLQIMLAAIQTQRETEQWQKESGEFIPYPATWIRGRLWEDETGEIIGEDDSEQKWSAEEGRYLPSKRKLREQREGR